MYEFDSSLIFVALKDGQALLADDPQLERGLEVRVVNHLRRSRYCASDCGDRGAGFRRSTDWTQNNAALFSALKLEKLTYFLVLLLIVLVAAFNIVATLVMVVMERRKEIAIVRAMGARAARSQRFSCAKARRWASVGTAIGVGAGFVTSCLIGEYHLIHLPPDLFMVSDVPVRLYAVNFIAVAAAAILLCISAAIYPALQARPLSPVEVIRYE